MHYVSEDQSALENTSGLVICIASRVYILFRFLLYPIISAIGEMLIKLFSDWSPHLKTLDELLLHT